MITAQSEFLVKLNFRLREGLLTALIIFKSLNQLCRAHHRSNKCPCSTVSS